MRISNKAGGRGSGSPQRTFQMETNQQNSDINTGNCEVDVTLADFRFTGTSEESSTPDTPVHNRSTTKVAKKRGRYTDTRNIPTIQSGRVGKSKHTLDKKKFPEAMAKECAKGMSREDDLLGRKTSQSLQAAVWKGDIPETSRLLNEHKNVLNIYCEEERSPEGLPVHCHRTNSGYYSLATTNPEMIALLNKAMENLELMAEAHPTT